LLTLVPKKKNYKRSIEIFEKAAADNIDHILLRWKVKEYLFKAILCGICEGIENDVEDWNEQKTSQEKYKKLNDLYATSHEAKLIDNILESLKTEFHLGYDGVCEFNRLQKLDEWHLNLFLIIQNYLRLQIYAPPSLQENGNNDDNDNDNDNDNNNNSKKIIKGTGDDPFNPKEIDTNAPDI